MMLGALLLVWAVASALPATAAAEQASEPTSLAAGQLDAGAYHTCAVLDDGSVRCWGYGAEGQLGYGNTNTIGDDEAPGSAGPVHLGPGRTAKAISAGDYHTCAVLDDGSVRCWGYGGDGRLGYGNTSNVTDPAAVGPVDLGPGRTAKAIAAGTAHTCALLDNGSVRCWGYNYDGNLGYANTKNIGDNKTPGAVGPVDLGPGRTAKAITAGQRHTCALLDNGSVRCWGYGLDGRLGYGNTDSIGDDETPGSVGPVDLGPGRTAKAITAGTAHTCAVLDDGSVRCWGNGANGRLGYADVRNVGDLESPGSVGPVDLGLGRTAVAISAGQSHTCARLDDESVRCWGDGAAGRLGDCSDDNVGDDETPGWVGPVSLGPGGSGGCPSSSDSPPSDGLAPTSTGHSVPSSSRVTSNSDLRRAGGLRKCLAAVLHHTTRERVLLRRGSARRRAALRRHLNRDERTGRSRCLRQYGRTPGAIVGLTARAVSNTTVELSFHAPGTDGSNAPPARAYVVMQSQRLMRKAPDFTRASPLCKGSCHFNVTSVGAKIVLMVTHLRSHTTYYYAIAARDDISAKQGPRSASVSVRTR